MTSKQRVLKTLAFDHPDQLPVHCWSLPDVYLKYGDPLRAEVAKYSVDFHYPDWDTGEFPFDRFAIGRATDAWGCEWLNCKQGIVGEVKNSPLADFSRLRDYRPPFHILDRGPDDLARLRADLAAHRDRFLLSPWTINIFERMQRIRGTENLFMDIAEESPEFHHLLEMVADFYDRWLTFWLQQEVDGIMFSDDWGSQTSLLISPASWRKYFRPHYKRMFDRVKQTGRRVFFHSDGHIDLIFNDLIELGCDAINSQVWIMNPERLSQLYRGRVTFWGEVDRQGTLPRGNPAEILREIKKMKTLFMHNGGGLIGVASPGADCTFEGAVESLAGWNKP